MTSGIEFEFLSQEEIEQKLNLVLEGSCRSHIMRCRGIDSLLEYKSILSLVNFNLKKYRKMKEEDDGQFSFYFFSFHVFAGKWRKIWEKYVFAGLFPLLFLLISLFLLVFLPILVVGPIFFSSIFFLSHSPHLKEHTPTDPFFFLHFLLPTALPLFPPHCPTTFSPSYLLPLFLRTFLLFLFFFFFIYLFNFCFPKIYHSLLPLTGPPTNHLRPATTSRWPSPSSPTFLPFSFFPTTLKSALKRELKFLFLLLFDLVVWMF